MLHQMEKPVASRQSPVVGKSVDDPMPAADCLKVIAACRDVGREEVMPRYLKVAHERKVDGSLLTEADVAAQNALFKRLRAIAPYPMLGEEMTDAEQRDVWALGDEGFWCVDPIDGTSNFVNGLPFFAISVALIRDRKSVLGVVYDPSADEAFYAIEGQGAFMNGERLPLKTPPTGVAPLHGRHRAEAHRPHPGRAPRLRASVQFPAQPGRQHPGLVLYGRRAHAHLSAWRPETLGLRRRLPDPARGRRRGLFPRRRAFLSEDPWCRSVLAALTPDLLAQWKSWVGV
jgi:myo-inositol-1(or 4)-monophosphatase